MHDTKEYYSTLCPTHINTCSDTHRQRQRHTYKKTHTPSQACGLRSVCLLLMSVSPGTPQLVPEGLMLVPLYVIFRRSPTVNFTFIFNKFHHMKINTQTHRHTDTDKYTDRHRALLSLPRQTDMVCLVHLIDVPSVPDVFNANDSQDALFTQQDNSHGRH